VAIGYLIGLSTPPVGVVTTTRSSSPKNVVPVEMLLNFSDEGKIVAEFYCQRIVDWRQASRRKLHVYHGPRTGVTKPQSPAEPPLELSVT
jgi:hypothetical protein